MILDRFLSLITRVGIEDRALAVFMLTGPLVILVLAVAGRSAGTTAIATAYACLFIFYVAYKGIRQRD